MKEVAVAMATDRVAKHPTLLLYKEARLAAESTGNNGLYSELAILNGSDVITKDDSLATSISNLSGNQRRSSVASLWKPSRNEFFRPKSRSQSP